MTAGVCLAAVAMVGCGHASRTHDVPAVPDVQDGQGMQDMQGMDMGGSPGAGIVAADLADNGLRAAVGGYSYVADTKTPSTSPLSPFSFHIVGPSGKNVTRFQPYEGQLLVFYLVRTDLGDFHRLAASMHDDGTWTVPMPALAPGAYRTYVTFAAPDSAAGTPLSYSLSQPLVVPGAPPATATTPGATVDGYTVELTGSLHQGAESDLGVLVTRNGAPVQQFDRLLDGYAHITAVRSGDAAFARALSTGRAAGGPAGVGALTAQIRFPESGTWRLFVQFQISGTEHTAAVTVSVP
ncbi:hypothetical protein ACFQ9X_18850 [Catenulispora yoronensis]